MANAASAYVVPTGRYLFAGLTGEDPSGNNEWRGASDIFNTGDSRGPFGSVTDAWKTQLLGRGTLEAPGQMQAALMESTGRYLGGPNNRSWSDRWNQWNATDVTGPDGQVLLSPMHQTGLRVGQSYGVRNFDGSIDDPWRSEMFQSALGVRNNLNQDRWLDPYQAQEGLRAMQQDSPWAMPNAGDYLSTMQRAQGGPGQADFYGQRGVDQTADLARANLRQLNRGIDTEAQNSLAMKLPEIGAAMQAAGLGRSGAAQQQMLQANNEILAQANRDKQRTMADFTDREANRQAQAINLGSQIGAQGYEGYAGRMGNAALAGLGDQFSANQANRQNEAALWSQSMQNRFGKNQGDQNALFQMLGQAGQYNMQGLEQERLGQSAALQDWLGLQAQREGMRSSSLQEMLSIADQERSIRQQRLNQQLSAGLLPFNTMLQIATGTTGGAPVQYAKTDPWSQLASAGIGAIPQLAGQFWNGPQQADGVSAYG